MSVSRCDCGHTRTQHRSTRSGEEPCQVTGCGCVDFDPEPAPVRAPRPDLRWVTVTSSPLGIAVLFYRDRDIVRTDSFPDLDGLQARLEAWIFHEVLP